MSSRKRKSSRSRCATRRGKWVKPEAGYYLHENLDGSKVPMANRAQREKVTSMHRHAPGTSARTKLNDERKRLSKKRRQVLREIATQSKRANYAT